MQNNPELLLLQQNMALRQIFTNRGLDLQEVMEFAPYDLDLENRHLQCLAEFIDEYERYGSQEAMELVKLEWVFPPVFPCISPESDWLRFERWLQGKPIQKRLAEMVSDKTEPFAAPESIPDDKMGAEINRLVSAIHAVGIGYEAPRTPRLLNLEGLVNVLGITPRLLNLEGLVNVLGNHRACCTPIYTKPWTTLFM